MKLENSGHDIYRSFLRVASDVICISFTRLFLDPLRRKFIVKRTFQDEIKTSISFQVRNFLSAILFLTRYYRNQRSLT